MTNSRRFYIYAYFRVDGTPYYIGRGQTNRINSPDHCVKLPPVARRKKLARMLTHDEANEWEQALVELLGKKHDGSGCLRNLKDGGEAQAGFRHRESTKRKLSEAATGRVVFVSPKRQKQLAEQCRTICADAELMAKRGKSRAVAAAEKMGIDVDRYLAQDDQMRLLINKRFYQHGLRGEYLFVPAGIQPRTVKSAEKMGVDPFWFAGLDRSQKTLVSQRFRYGKRGADLIAGIVAA